MTAPRATGAATAATGATTVGTIASPAGVAGTPVHAAGAPIAGAAPAPSGAIDTASSNDREVMSRRRVRRLAEIRKSLEGTPLGDQEQLRAGIEAARAQGHAVPDELLRKAHLEAPERVHPSEQQQPAAAGEQSEQSRDVPHPLAGKPVEQQQEGTQERSTRSKKR